MNIGLLSPCAVTPVMNVLWRSTIRYLRARAFRGDGAIRNDGLPDVFQKVGVLHMQRSEATHWTPVGDTRGDPAVTLLSSWAPAWAAGWCTRGLPRPAPWAHVEMLRLSEVAEIVDSKLVLGVPLLQAEEQRRLARKGSIGSQLSDEAQEQMGIRQSRDSLDRFGQQDRRRWRSWSPNTMLTRRSRGWRPLSQDALAALLAVKSAAQEAAKAAASAASAVRRTLKCFCLECEVKDEPIWPATPSTPGDSQAQAQPQQEGQRSDVTPQDGDAVPGRPKSELPQHGG